MRRSPFFAAACLVFDLIGSPSSAASPLDGNTYIVEMSSSQSASGFGA